MVCNKFFFITQVLSVCDMMHLLPSVVGKYGEMYDNHLCLARFFTEPEDEWLKHNFFQLALQSARKLKIDSGKREAEALLHIGQIYLVKGKNI